MNKIRWFAMLGIVLMGLCFSLTEPLVSRADEGEVIDVSDVPQESGGGGDDYTPEQKAQAKAWLSAHGYPPTRAGANQAYADFMAGKFNNDPAVMAQARAYGLIPPEDPAENSADNNEWAQIVVDESEEEVEEATPEEPEIATPEKPEKTEKATPAEATPGDTDDQITRKAEEDSTFVKVMRIVYIAIVAILAIIGITAIVLRFRNRV
ncbi:MAG: hypothetical protein IJ619_06955 [Eubacterium sp.]|nr:hypothetical protein [Eubacterium sp.]